MIKPKIIFFDLHDTLSTSKGFTTAEFLKKEIGLSNSSLSNVLEKVESQPKFKNWWPNLRNIEQEYAYYISLIEDIYKELEVNIASEKLQEINKERIENKLKRNPTFGSKETLKYLSDSYAMGIISNGIPSCKKEIKALSFNIKFDPIVISSEVGVKKPDPQIYQIAANKANADTNECILVDNKLSYINGALLAGFNMCFYLNDNRGNNASFSYKRITSIRKLTEMKNYL